MSKIINEIGNIYGKLTVVKSMGSKKGRTIWLCQCECGNTTIVIGLFNTIEEAIKIRKEAEKKYFGEYRRIK